MPSARAPAPALLELAPPAAAAPGVVGGSASGFGAESPETLACPAANTTTGDAVCPVAGAAAACAAAVDAVAAAGSECIVCAVGKLPAALAVSLPVADPAGASRIGCGPALGSELLCAVPL